jgi:hypothetical protein
MLIRKATSFVRTAYQTPRTAGNRQDVVTDADVE